MQNNEMGSGRWREIGGLISHTTSSNASKEDERCNQSPGRTGRGLLLRFKTTFIPSTPPHCCCRVCYTKALAHIQPTRAVTGARQAMVRIKKSIHWHSRAGRSVDPGKTQRGVHGREFYYARAEKRNFTYGGRQHALPSWP